MQGLLRQRATQIMDLGAEKEFMQDEIAVTKFNCDRKLKLNIEFKERTCDVKDPTRRNKRTISKL